MEACGQTLEIRNARTRFDRCDWRVNDQWFSTKKRRNLSPENQHLGSPKDLPKLVGRAGKKIQAAKLNRYATEAVELCQHAGERDLTRAADFPEMFSAVREYVVVRLIWFSRVNCVPP